MTASATDTAARSLAHWSEAGRAEMDAFYALATEDYRQLAMAADWPARLRAAAGDRPRVRLLDVACGSGKFPTALVRHGGVSPASTPPVDVDLLDPSAFSVAETRAALAPPFVPGAELVIGVEELPPATQPYDVVWATHALYAVPPQVLAEGLRRMLLALRPGGLGLVAHATAASHYLAVHDRYLAGPGRGSTRFLDAGQVEAGLRDLGAAVVVDTVRYTTGTDDDAVAEGFLQRCLFDDTLTLHAMRADPELGPYLAGCRTEPGGWLFQHEVQLIWFDVGGAR